jgi:fatty acid CoA ligase FadD9
MTDGGGMTDTREMRRIAELYATDQQVRDAEPLQAVATAIRRPGQSPAAIVAGVMDAYADRPALGERAREPSTAPSWHRR